MTETRPAGYRGESRVILEREGAGPWSRVRIDSTRGTFEGIILPRSQTADDRHIVLKLESGYNVGVAVRTIRSITELGRREPHYRIPPRPVPYQPNRPDVLLLSTGGTIASRLDYRTGAVMPAFSPAELYSSVPELTEICNLRTKELFRVLGEDMGPAQYIGLARRIGEEIERGVSGIVVGHGTDTMHHTAAVLSFMVQDTPVPIVMVGSQRSADRPSSDGPVNLMNAVKTAAESDIAEVVVCMSGPTSDDYGLLHRGTRVRKMHSSYRSTFRTVGDIPLAMIDRRQITPLRSDYRRRRADRSVRINPSFEEKVALLYIYPNMQPDVVEALVEHGYRGIVFAGTGLGHINKPIYAAVRRAVDRGVHIFMTAQTLWGYVQMYVYETGREIMKLGVVPAANMLPETAYMKLCWTLGQTDDRDEVQQLMLTPICGETTEREPYNGYLIFQGAIPEVQSFLRSINR